MPNGRGQRDEHEKELIEIVESNGWNHYSQPPDWIRDAAESDGLHNATAGFKAAKKTYYGDNYVYLAVSSVHGGSIHVFSQKKSEYFETSREEGTCPNCQEYVRRLEGDDVLTCHRCGWQYEDDSITKLNKLTDLF
jgi:hypothetical protein